MQNGSQVTVELLFFTGCPNAPDALALVHGCVAQLGLDAIIVERAGDYASPSVRVNGRDVMGAATTAGRACRRDLPTAERVMNALRAAMRGVSG